MIKIDPKEIEIPKLHHYLLGSVGPRPICFASTIDSKGNRNLSPFSFFNVFSANPPIMVFSPARSGRTNTTKNTYDNVVDVPEVVINVVTYSMVNQMSLTSSPYPKGVDEFEKGGFTAVASENIRPYRVAESPIQMECKVLEVKELGHEGAAGNLVICELLCIHLDETILDDKAMVDQQKVDLVARMGGSWYCRAYGDALFQLDKPITSLGIGIDALPEAIRNSKELSGNELGLLGSLTELPKTEEIRNQIDKLSKEKITLSNAKLALNRGEWKLAYCILSECLS